MIRVMWATILLFCAGCNLQGLADRDVPPDGPGDDKDVVPPSPSSESDYWNAVADVVEAGVFTNTDQIVLWADAMEDSFDVKLSDSKLSDFKSTRTEITDDNRRDIAERLRAGN